MSMGFGGEAKIAKILGAGVVMIIGSAIGFFFFGWATILAGSVFGLVLSALCVLIGLGGLGTVIYALVLGMGTVMQDDSKKPMETHRGAYVISKVVTTTEGEPVFDVDDYDEDDLRFYVQLQLATGKKLELHSPMRLWSQIGEGMKGTMTLQGRSMTSWVPEIGTQSRHNDRDIPPDPFASGQL
jgi:hypothetical protein